MFSNDSGIDSGTYLVEQEVFAANYSITKLYEPNQKILLEKFMKRMKVLVRIQRVAQQCRTTGSRVITFMFLS